MESEEALREFEQMAIDLTWNMSVHEEEEQQKTTTTAGNNISLIQEIQTDIDKIPVYLTKRNPSFQEMVHNIHLTIKTTGTIIIDPTNNKECIRKIGLLIYQIMIIQTYHSLWSTYLKSGSGELIITAVNEPKPSYHVNIPIWPNELKALFLAIVKIPMKDTENQQYFNFVSEQLQLMDGELNRCRTQLNIFANKFHGYTLQIQNTIKSYIDEHSHSFRMQIKHQIELLHYDYHIGASKLEYIRHRPNPFQEQILKEICQIKYEHATNEQEYQFICKQFIHNKNLLNHTIQNSSLAQAMSSLISSDPPIPDGGQQLFQQVETIIDQARNEIFQTYMNVFDEKRKACRKKYEESIKKLWSIHRQPIDHIQTIPSNMIQIILDRCTKIGERIDCIYKFKAQSNLL